MRTCLEQDRRQRNNNRLGKPVRSKRRSFDQNLHYQSRTIIQHNLKRNLNNILQFLSKHDLLQVVPPEDQRAPGLLGYTFTLARYVHHETLKTNKRNK